MKRKESLSSEKLEATRRWRHFGRKGLWRHSPSGPLERCRVAIKRQTVNKRRKCVAVLWAPVTNIRPPESRPISNSQITQKMLKLNVIPTDHLRSFKCFSWSNFKWNGAISSKNGNLLETGDQVNELETKTRHFVLNSWNLFRISFSSVGRAEIKAGDGTWDSQHPASL